MDRILVDQIDNFRYNRNLEFIEDDILSVDLRRLVDSVDEVFDIGGGTAAMDEMLGVLF